MDDLEVVVGIMCLDFYVECPQCSKQFWQSDEWFDSTMGSDFSTNDIHDKYEAKCSECNKEFIIDGFVQ